MAHGLAMFGRRVLAPAVVVFAFTASDATFGEGARAAVPKADPKSASAADLAEQALKAYEAGDFAGAIALYTKSFQSSNDARTLYNIASIYDKKLHDRVLAQEYYRRYLKSDTAEPDLVAKSNTRLADLEKEDRKESEAPAQPKEKPAPPPEEPKGATALPLRTIGLAAGGAGVVALAVGGVFGLSALSDASSLHAQCPNDVCRTGEGAKLRDTAAREATLSTIFVAVGALLAGGGAALYFLAPAPPSKTALSVRPSLGFQRATLSVSGAF